MRVTLLFLLVLVGCSSVKETTKGCERAGCNAELCVEAGMKSFSACLYKPTNACFQHAVCERQPTGQCGWTETPAYQTCVKSTFGE